MAAQSCNSETASGDQAMKRQCGERQVSLKAALIGMYNNNKNVVSGFFKKNLKNISTEILMNLFNDLMKMYA